MVSSEASPLAKTGGLADVVGTLPAALQALGDHVAVVIPRYASIDLTRARRVWDRVPVFLGKTSFDASVYLYPEEFPLYLVDCPELFDRPGLYGDDAGDYPDNHVRFAVLSRVALAVARFLFRTEVFHCHDWQAGLLPVYLNTSFSADPTFLGVKTVFTIHNLGYQGLFPRTAVDEAALPASVFRPDAMEFYGRFSYIKGGIVFADAITTVSPTYAREIQTPEYGWGLDGVLRARSPVLHGILNGVDYRAWNPENDPLIPAHFSPRDLSGKRICKERLLAEVGLPSEAIDLPLAGVISRFAHQKGMDLIAEITGDMIAEGMCLVVLGSGEPWCEDFFRRMAAEYPGQVAAKIGFDNGLAHRIEAGADLFLMPSRYEPSGLNQMYSLRYGTVPVVRATGGLNDTIEEATGFKFVEYSGQALLGAIRAAGKAFSDPEGWEAMMLRGMKQDFSWSRSAEAYSALYRGLTA